MIRLVSIRSRKLRRILQARIARLLRMELHAEHVVALDDRRRTRWRAWWRRCSPPVTGAAYEWVKYTCAPSARPRSRRLGRLDEKSSAFHPTCGTLIRSAGLPRSRAIRPGSMPEARHFRRFVAALEQPLHAQTDPEQRSARGRPPPRSRRAIHLRVRPWPRSARRRERSGRRLPRIQPARAERCIPRRAPIAPCGPTSGSPPRSR